MREIRKNRTRLSGTLEGCALLGMMNKCDGELIGALKMTEMLQELCNLAGGVLIDRVNPNEGIEDKELRL